MARDCNPKSDIHNHLPQFILCVEFTSGGEKMNKRLSKIHQHMLQRCYNPNDDHYKRYGARGITVCEEWRDTAIVSIGKARYSRGNINFQMWAIENGYNDSLTIDRINNDKGYTSSNCRWVSMKVQSNNRCSNHLINYKNKKVTISQLSEETGISQNVLWKRLVRDKWDFERAITTEVKSVKSN